MVKRINVTIAKVSMIIKGYECGPGVPKFLVQLTHKVSGVIADKRPKSGLQVRIVRLVEYTCQMTRDKKLAVPVSI